MADPTTASVPGLRDGEHLGEIDDVFTGEIDDEGYRVFEDRARACGSWKPGHGTVLCPTHLAQARRQYPQGWAYYPGDVCKHGKYTGGCGADLMCGPCEMGD